MKLLAETEGIIPALESAHAVAYAATVVPKLSPEQVVIINISGRGDKDLQGVARFLGELHEGTL
jgi:tryptophan synthase beta chain